VDLPGLHLGMFDELGKSGEPLFEHLLIPFVLPHLGFDGFQLSVALDLPLDGHPVGASAVLVGKDARLDGHPSATDHDVALLKVQDQLECPADSAVEDPALDDGHVALLETVRTAPVLQPKPAGCMSGSG